MMKMKSVVGKLIQQQRGVQSFINIITYQHIKLEEKIYLITNIILRGLELDNHMFIELIVRVNGEKKYIDARKFFDYMIKEYSKVKYGGKKIDPYPDRVNNFYNNIPQDLVIMWGKAYPNVDVKGECEKARVWLLSNTNKAKKDFKGFTNRWLGKACQNGGSIPIQMEHKIEKKIKEHKEYVEQAQINSADDEWRKTFLKDLASKIKGKNG